MKLFRGAHCSNCGERRVRRAGSAAGLNRFRWAGRRRPPARLETRHDPLGKLAVWRVCEHGGGDDKPGLAGIVGD
jgi:hypothetical protein